MKPISVRFKGFGPYRKEVFVDFAALEKNGLFLICGETGAGKTTILDAICYALYGKSSGGIRGDLSVMRCKLAEPSEETLVEFVFEVNGKRYQFVRSLRYGRKNLIDSHNCMVLEDGNYVPLFENPKLKNVNQKAEELIGLSYEQFRQVIILPQGQFEKLLVSDSVEKEKILVSLFKAEKWQIIAEEMYNRIAEQDKELRGEIADIRSRLSDYKCETIEELEMLSAQQGEKLKQLENQAKEAERQEQEQKKVCDKAARINEQFLELKKRQTKEQQLSKKETEMQLLEAKLEKADRADAVKEEYRSYHNVKEAVEKSRSKAELLKGKQKEAEENLLKIQTKKAAHEAGLPAYEAGVKRFSLLENARELYASLGQQKKDVEQAEKVYLAKKKDAEQVKYDYDKKHQFWLEKMEEQKVKIEAYTMAQQQYLSGISGTLAAKLALGEPCPVCGSIEHPSPAQLEGAKVTEAELDTHNKNMTAANRAVEKAASDREKSERLYQKAFLEEQEAGQQMISAKTTYEEVLKQKIEGIETSEELEVQITDLKNRIEKYNELTVRFQNYLMDAKGNVKAIEEALKTTERELQEAVLSLAETAAVWEKSYIDAGFENEEAFIRSLMKPEEKNRETVTCHQFKAELQAARLAVEEQKAVLQGEEVPDVAVEQQKLSACIEVQKRASKEWILGQQFIEKMQKDLNSLSTRKAEHDAKRIKVDEDLNFANRLRGRTGISLQRYVLGVMLSSITAEANRLLKNVHNGRYQLYRTDTISGSGHKGGLELEVLDMQNNERRSVTTLSGGEKFLVALSLAIGLSTVVQAQGKGIRLGAMFIDEGFGSLDQNSIYDALEVLQGIQKANGLVGIISHVELLKDVIPSRIEVKKRKDGSELVVI